MLHLSSGKTNVDVSAEEYTTDAGRERIGLEAFCLQSTRGSVTAVLLLLEKLQRVI